MNSRLVYSYKSEWEKRKEEKEKNFALWPTGKKLHRKNDCLRQQKQAHSTQPYLWRSHVACIKQQCQAVVR